MRVLVALVLILPAFSGCLSDIGDWFSSFTPPDAQVEISPMLEGIAGPGDGPWNRDGDFLVRATSIEPYSVRIEADDGVRVLSSLTPAWDAVRLPNGLNVTEATISIPDGIWDISFWIDDHPWDTLATVHIDSTSPEIQGIEFLGVAEEGRYLIGASASVPDDGFIQIQEQSSGRLIGTRLPLQVSGLGDGIYAYDVIIRDEAGNSNIYTIQVRAGSAKELPEGRFTLGIVARYTNDAVLWDLSRPEDYLAPAQAATRLGGDYLGDGFGIDPDHAEVQAVLADVVTPEMTTMEVAWALYVWMYDELEYDDARLDADDLLDPDETLANGGGVCRDLAALYVSLLRGAGVPARLVTGYIAGTVNGFHAWVEFYAGAVDGQGAWIPVDVSPIDGAFDLNVAMQAFGIKRPDYLTLRDVPVASEVEGWSTAISASVTYYGDEEPEFELQREVDLVAPVERILCVDFETRIRFVAGSPEGCEGLPFLRDFPVRIEQVIDYGISVQGEADGTMTASIAYPFEASVRPDGVDYLVYGPAAWTRDTSIGHVVMEVEL